MRRGRLVASTGDPTTLSTRSIDGQAVVRRVIEMNESTDMGQREHEHRYEQEINQTQHKAQNVDRAAVSETPAPVPSTDDLHCTETEADDGDESKSHRGVAERELVVHVDLPRSAQLRDLLRTMEKNVGRRNMPTHVEMIMEGPPHTRGSLLQHHSLRGIVPMEWSVLSLHVSMTTNTHRNNPTENEIVAADNHEVCVLRHASKPTD